MELYDEFDDGLGAGPEAKGDGKDQKGAADSSLVPAAGSSAMVQGDGDQR